MNNRIIEFTSRELVAEIWRHIVGYEGYYSISDLGRARREVGGRGLCVSGRILRPIKVNDYYSYGLCLNGKIRQFRVHKLVATSFIGPRPDGYEINHIDLNNFNNRACNLEYRTRQENQQHAVEHWAHSHGERHGMAKLTRAQALEIKLSDDNPNALGERFQVTPATVRDIKRGATWKCLA